MPSPHSATAALLQRPAAMALGCGFSLASVSSPVRLKGSALAPRHIRPWERRPGFNADPSGPAYFRYLLYLAHPCDCIYLKANGADRQARYVAGSGGFAGDCGCPGAVTRGCPRTAGLELRPRTNAVTRGCPRTTELRPPRSTPGGSTNRKPDTKLEPRVFHKRACPCCVSTTGRLVAHGKRGHIDPALEPILVRLGLSTAQWTLASTAFRPHYRNGDLRLKQTA